MWRLSTTRGGGSGCCWMMTRRFRSDPSSRASWPAARGTGSTRLSCFTSDNILWRRSRIVLCLVAP
ncbi:unnamed protein product [Ascophyllum nodosum]